MKFRQYIEEEISTATAGELDADAVTSNKLLRVKLKDNKIKKLVKFLQSRKNTSVEIKDNIATIDIPYGVDKSIMKKLSSYTI